MRPDLIRVVLVDDHQIVRSGLKAVLATAKDISVVGEGGTGKDGLVLAERLNPHVLVMDLSMPDMDGLTATRELQKLNAARAPNRVGPSTIMSRWQRIRISPIMPARPMRWPSSGL